MKRYRITLDGRTFEVRVLGDPRRRELEVEVDGELFTVHVEAAPPDAEAGRAEATPEVSPGTSPRIAGSPDSEITAPLPGVVKSVAVRPGEGVTAGEPLLVIEAMKMDNVIRAPRGGTIGAVHVTQGGQVAHGDLLLEFAE